MTANTTKNMGITD